MAQADYIYLDGRPVAVLNGSTLYYLHTDHLGTPQLATDSNQAVAWLASYDSFGQASVSGTITQNLRLLGQYFDRESGWNHNDYRNYLPEIGRYAEPDPRAMIGTASYFSPESGQLVNYGVFAFSGYINAFVYTDNDPIDYSDPHGLSPSGGPWHPPAGVSLKCTDADSCPQLQAKMQLLMKMTNSHQGWDWHVPPPRGGGRHALEIADLWRAYARCLSLYSDKCINCQSQKSPAQSSSTVPNPVGVPFSPFSHGGIPFRMPWSGPVSDSPVEIPDGFPIFEF